MREHDAAAEAKQRYLEKLDEQRAERCAGSWRRLGCHRCAAAALIEIFRECGADRLRHYRHMRIVRVVDAHENAGLGRPKPSNLG